MKKNLVRRLANAFVLIASLAALSGCGGGSSNPKYSIGGSVTGLVSGASVALLNEKGDAVTMSTNGSFVFSTALATGASYLVTVSTQPIGETCSVSGGSGTIGTTNVTNIVVSCTAKTYALGGLIQGLGDAGLVLANGSDTLKVAANATSFTMPTVVAYGNPYNVSVKANPPALSCTVINGAGTMPAANVTSISVSCVAGTESALYSFAGYSDGAVPYGSLIQASDGNLYGTTAAGGTSGDGTVFKITPGGAETVLYSFKGGTTDGDQPYGSLVQASDGDFYGMTDIGGASGDGTVFKITPGGTETVLYSFRGGATDGSNPFGGLVQASDGDLYGMTYSGGASGDGTVFKITPGGTETVLHFFKGGTADGGGPYGNLIQASDGNFYGMTNFGGVSGPGTVFKITSGGTETVLYSFKGGTADGGSPFGSLIQASDGDFYGMTDLGGTSGAGTVFKITPGGIETVLYSFKGGTADGSGPYGSLIQASDGNFYGMTTSGGTNNFGTILKITPGGTETLLYSFLGGTTDGEYPNGSLIQASNGDLYGMTRAGGPTNAGIVSEFN